MIIRINLGMANAKSHGIDYLNLVSLLELSLVSYGSVSATCTKISGGGDWEPEEILIAEISVDDIEFVNRALEALSVVLDEDSIAVSVLGNEGYLIWNPNYTGEKYEFNSDYFLN